MTKAAVSLPNPQPRQKGGGHPRSRSRRNFPRRARPRGADLGTGDSGDFSQEKTITHPFGEGVLRQGAGQNGSILPLNNHPISSSQPVSSMDATAHPGPWLLPFSSLPLKGTWLPPRTSSASCPGSPLWQPKFRRLSEQQRFLCRRKIHFPLSLYSSAHPNPRGLQRTRRLPTESAGGQQDSHQLPQPPVRGVRQQAGGLQFPPRPLGAAQLLWLARP